MRVNTTVERTAAEIETKLRGYDIITFDVFDTLITRCVLKPADVFAVVEAEAKRKKILSGSFASDRRCAEQTAYAQYGQTANFQQIYAMLRDRFSYTDTQCNALMELELETELRLVTPRIALREITVRLIAAGKRIVLCSDMYLSSEAIRKLLVRCGYPENLELWVSSEKGATKQSGKLWDMLFSYLPSDKKSIHVGDNECADYQRLRQLGKDAILIDSGFSLFEQSELYGYMSKYITDDIGNSLILGYLVNKACFNSPFKGTDSDNSDNSIVSVWGGAAFACFMNFLAKHRDDSQLLFATREGYFLKPMYELYCKRLGTEPQCCTLFYSSRTAATAATITTEQDIWDILRHPDYQGTLGHFVKSRMNFDVSFDREIYDLQITLPAQQRDVFKILEPYLPQIFQNGNAQRVAYQKYISELRQDGKPLTIVDIGYNGTIQYAVSKILFEKVSGLYLFLNDGALPRKNGCSCCSVANPRAGQHPIYDNLLFLEAVMQVPYGQLQKMDIVDGRITPTFNTDANFSKYIPVAQKAFCDFVVWIAGWQKSVGDELKLDFELAEAIWACLLQFDFLPGELLDSFWLADDFCGHPMWKYDSQKREWISNRTATPLAFTLVKSGEPLSLKQKVKTIIKKNIPYFAYDWASAIWAKYIK